MLSHLSLGISDLDVARRFYDAIMQPLGAARVWTGEAGLGYGTPGYEQLNLFLVEGAIEVGAGFHLAFAAPDPAAVDAWHAGALANGGSCNGPPGLRPHYGNDYYAAFVRDPFGHRLEAKVQPVGGSGCRTVS